MVLLAAIPECATKTTFGNLLYISSGGNAIEKNFIEERNEIEGELST